jgi:SAM-dependent methyltransferase
MSNPFGTETAARLYAAGRPTYSALVTPIIRRLTGITEPVHRAVDVASGTGISTMAIAPLAITVFGVEPSEAMRARAAPARNVTYLSGTAEDLPLEDGSCDLIAVGSALHWFDRERFLAEASRVAAPATWLVVHNHWFNGAADGVAGFADWTDGVYGSRYPVPPRDRSWMPPDDLGDWRHVGWETYDHPVSFTADRLVAYLLTQSNLTSVMAVGDETEDGLRSWLAHQLAPFFVDTAVRVFSFGGYVAVHRHVI